MGLFSKVFVTVPSLFISLLVFILQYLESKPFPSLSILLKCHPNNEVIFHLDCWYLFAIPPVKIYSIIVQKYSNYHLLFIYCDSEILSAFRYCTSDISSQWHSISFLLLRKNSCLSPFSHPFSMLYHIVYLLWFLSILSSFMPFSIS